MMLRLSEFRTGLTKVATYGHIPVPLVYTQVYFSTRCVYLCKYLCIHLYSFEPFCVHICVYFFTPLCIPVYTFVCTQVCFCIPGEGIFPLGGSPSGLFPAGKYKNIKKYKIFPARWFTWLSTSISPRVSLENSGSLLATKTLRGRTRRCIFTPPTSSSTTTSTAKKHLTSGGSILSHLHDVPVPLRVWLAPSRRDPL